MMLRNEKKREEFSQKKITEVFETLESVNNLKSDGNASVNSMNSDIENIVEVYSGLCQTFMLPSIMEFIRELYQLYE